MNATTVRDALVALLDERMIEWKDSAEDVADAILALVRPIEGVTLTGEERQAFETADIVLRHYGYQPTADLLSAVVARLEAAQ